MGQNQPITLRIIFITLCLLTGIISALPAQYQSIKFSHLSPVDGLSQSTVRAICQDTFGFMWFGTYDGLNKYDGKKITVYRHDEQDSLSLPDNSVVDIYEDRQHQLWISTRSGLCYLDREKDQFVRVFPDQKNEEQTFVELAEDDQGDLWISGDNGALYRKEPGQENFVAYYNPLSQEHINEFILLKNGLIWLSSSDNRLYEFDPSSEAFRVVLEQQRQEIISVFEDQKRDVIWLGTSEAGIKTYDQKQQRWDSIIVVSGDPHSLPDSIVWAMSPGIDDELLLGTNNGMAIIHLDQWYQHKKMRVVQHHSGDPHSISSNYIYRLYRGDDDVFWVGTTDAGISIWDRKKQQFNHIYRKAGLPHTLSSNVIWHFEEDDQGNFWIGTSVGINHFNVQTGEVNHYTNDPNNPSSLPHNRVWQILRTAPDHYWLGTTSGVTSMQLDAMGEPRFTIYHPTQEEAQNSNFGTVRQLLRDHQGQLWVGTFWGLYIFDEVTKRYKGYHHNPDDPNSISTNSVRVIFEDSNHRLWIGTTNGLNLYRPETDNFIHFLPNPSDSTSLNHATVRSMAEDKQGRLWVGTGKGLNELIFPKNGNIHELSFRAYTQEDGLPNETIYSMEVDDDGFIWISTNNGLSRFNPDQRTFHNFHTFQGLQSHEFNSAASLKASNGHLLFGGINGFNYFDPQAIPVERNDYSIRFTDFKVNYKSVNPGSRYLDQHINVEEAVHLDYVQDRMFYFEFTVLDLLHADTRKFAYRLFPFEEEWNEVGAINNASYTNIPPGHYRFQVKSADVNDQWGQEVAEMSVYIRPAYWQTTWFLVLCLLGIIGVIYSLYRYRLRSIYQRQQYLEETIDERTAQIREQKQGLEQTLTTLKETQSKLIASEKMASLGQLTAGIAHEINNPVSFINGNAEALSMDFQDARPVLEKLLLLDANPEYPEEINHLIQLAKKADFDMLVTEMSTLVDGIKRGSERVSEIVRGLRIITHQSNDIFRPENLEELLESACVILSNKCKEKEIQVTRDFHLDQKVVCQAGKINQVIINILDNAIDAMEQGGVLKLSTASEKDTAVITIQDNGQGMSEATCQRLFDPFFTTKEVGKGTGLGLYISYGIVKQHNGTIEVKSKEGQGTTFTVQLPIDNG